MQKAGFILDGFPRNAQAVTLDSELQNMGLKRCSSLVAVEPEVIVERLSSRCVQRSVVILHLLVQRLVKLPW